MSLNLNYISHTPQEVKLEFEMEWQEVKCIVLVKKFNKGNVFWYSS